MIKEYPDEPLYDELILIYLEEIGAIRTAMSDRFQELWNGRKGMSDADAMKQTLLEFGLLPAKYQQTMLQMNGAQEYEDILAAQEIMQDQS